MPPRWDNLDDFFSLDDFAVPATITPRSGTPYQIIGHFDDPYLNAELGGDALDRDDVRPKFTCKFSDVSGVQRYDWIFVEGANYQILSAPHGDGLGIAVLELARNNE